MGADSVCLVEHIIYGYGRTAVESWDVLRCCVVSVSKSCIDITGLLWTLGARCTVVLCQYVDHLWI